MKVQIILIGSGGELDRQTIEANENASIDVLDVAIQNALKCWMLGPGDCICIRIVEVEDGNETDLHGANVFACRSAS
jgi:hypothetical protein